MNWYENKNKWIARAYKTARLKVIWRKEKKVKSLNLFVYNNTYKEARALSSKKKKSQYCYSYKEACCERVQDSSARNFIDFIGDSAEITDPKVSERQSDP